MISRQQLQFACLLGLWCLTYSAIGADTISAGPLVAGFPLTLSAGNRTEILGPLFYEQHDDTGSLWGIPPLGISMLQDPDVQSREFDFLYPLLTDRVYGSQYRWQVLQLFSFAGGDTPEAGNAKRFTLFPFYFQQRAPDPAENYTALLPFYGELQHRLFRDKIDFVMLPFYVKTQKRDVTTWNMPYPLFDLRKGNGLHGWHLWPLIGKEHKVVTTETNGFGDKTIVGGHDNLFVLWPFFWDEKSGIGTDNPGKLQALVPFYSYSRSPLRDSTSWPWPLGITHTVNREKDNKFEEWDAPWPFVEFAHGEAKTVHRVWPFFSHGRSASLEDDWYAWPLYKYNRITSAPLDRKRTRILFFLYSDTNEKNTDTGKARHRVDFFPFFTRERDFNGKSRFQVFSLLDPFFPSNPSIERDYDPLYALWRAEKNPQTGASSQSLLWNLWRRDAAPGRKNISLLFGLFQYQSDSDQSRWRVFYLPVASGKKTGTAPTAQAPR